ncbi:hypothetical protein J6590_064866 [Homalodisca vitripennis]|nr:hypothetical protein J6590_064866 [Homalodisca vitripennis]
MLHMTKVSAAAPWRRHPHRYGDRESVITGIEMEVLVVTGQCEARYYRITYFHWPAHTTRRPPPLAVVLLGVNNAHLSVQRNGEPHNGTPPLSSRCTRWSGDTTAARRPRLWASTRSGPHSLVATHPDIPSTAHFGTVIILTLIDSNAPYSGAASSSSGLTSQDNI